MRRLDRDIGSKRHSDHLLIRHLNWGATAPHLASASANSLIRSMPALKVDVCRATQGRTPRSNCSHCRYRSAMAEKHSGAEPTRRGRGNTRDALPGLRIWLVSRVARSFQRRRTTNSLSLTGPTLHLKPRPWRAKQRAHGLEKHRRLADSDLLRAERRSRKRSTPYAIIAT